MADDQAVAAPQTDAPMTSSPPAAPDGRSIEPSAPVPEWVTQLGTNIAAGVAHMFALTLNVGDFVPYVNGGDRYRTLKEFLRSDVFRTKRLVIFYDRSSGITFGGTTPEATQEMEDTFRKLSGLTRHEDALRGMDPQRALDALERVLAAPPEQVKELLGKGAMEFPPGSVVVVIGFAETLAPAGDIGRMDTNDRTNIVTLARWARSKAIEERQNLVILLTVNEADLASHLRNAAADVVTIRVPLPKAEERAAFLGATVARRSITLPSGTDRDQLVRATAGLSLRTVDDIIRLAVLDRHPLDVEWIWQHKKVAIERMCGGLLEVVRPVWTFDHVGGLAHVKRFLTEVAASIRAGRVIAVPQGILFLGPPGTGKTIMAEALATELGFPMVKLRNIREMWHGNTERNQALVFDLIEEFAPVVVFEDELDQQEQARGTAFHGDGGISARLLARKLAFLSDTRHRGRILWIAASNRPDLMDAAMLRPGRFDTKIPFLLPTPDERPEILAALTRKLTHHAALAGFPIAWAVGDDPLAAIARELDGYSGAEMELLLTRAVAYAGRQDRTEVLRADVEWAREDFIHSRTEAEYEVMTLRALQHCNSFELLPEEYHERARLVQTVAGLARILALDAMLKGQAIPENPFDPKQPPKAKA